MSFVSSSEAPSSNFQNFVLPPQTRTAVSGGNQATDPGSIQNRVGGLYTSVKPGMEYHRFESSQPPTIQPQLQFLPPQQLKQIRAQSMLNATENMIINFKEIAQSLNKDAFLKGDFRNLNNEYSFYRATEQLVKDGKILIEQGDTLLQATLRALIHSDKESILKYVGVFLFLFRFALSASEKNLENSAYNFLWSFNAKNENVLDLLLHVIKQCPIESNPTIWHIQPNMIELCVLANNLAEKNNLNELFQKGGKKELLRLRVPATLRMFGKIYCTKDDTLGHIAMSHLLDDLEKDSLICHLGLVSLLLYTASRCSENLGKEFMVAKNSEGQGIFYHLSSRLLNSTEQVMGSSSNSTQAIVVPLQGRTVGMYPESTSLAENRGIIRITGQIQPIQAPNPSFLYIDEYTECDLSASGMKIVPMEIDQRGPAQEEEESPEIRSWKRMKLQTIRENESPKTMLAECKETIKERIIDHLRSKLKVDWSPFTEKKLAEEISVAHSEVSKVFKNLVKTPELSPYWSWFDRGRAHINNCIKPNRIYGRIILQNRTVEQLQKALWEKIGEIFEREISSLEVEASQSVVVTQNKNHEEKTINLSLVNNTIDKLLSIQDASYMSDSDEFKKMIKKEMLKLTTEDVEKKYDLEKMLNLIVEVLPKRIKIKENLEENFRKRAFLNIDAIQVIINYKLWQFASVEVASLFDYDAPYFTNLFKKIVKDVSIPAENKIEKSLNWTSDKGLIEKLVNKKNLWVYTLLDGQDPETYVKGLDQKVDQFYTELFQKYLDNLKGRRG